MNTPSYCVTTLDNRHERQNFSCGLELLDRYLAQQAGQDAKRYIAATYVLTEIASNKVIGYYTLSATGIPIDTLPEEVIKKLPRYPTLPATLLGRLAVDQQYQGHKLGELLLMDALKRSLKISTEIASLAVIVEAKNDKATKFYAQYGFTQFPERKTHLYLPMQTIAKIEK